MKNQRGSGVTGSHAGLKILNFPNNPDWLIATDVPGLAKPVAISGRHAWDTVPDKVRVVRAMVQADG